MHSENPLYTIGQVTTELLAGGHESPLMQEFEHAAANPGDFVMLWAGAYRGHGGPETVLSWAWTKEADNGAEEGAPGPLDESVPARLERLLSPLAHEARVRILQALHERPRSASELGEAVGMRGGSLYYHLKELQYANYIRGDGTGYALTDLGRQLFLTLSYVALQVVRDRGQEGLAVGGPGQQ
ncbi:MAG: winged helix-turn-helix domain-containing protein [Armatimonadia bacterium]|nr:winged helix-turn-helix domain-containing protein [bacterium]